MRRLLLLALALPVSVAVQAAEPDGQQLFEHKCAMCHGPVGMGTGLLARRMKPEVAPLEKRDDLSAAYVERAARIGILNMPPITRADVSDAQLALIARYLSKGKP
ncbi:MAG TPA: cytochrome c [Steroidobacteraceae bacterium]|jgi:mono/diheme cytochrome c family protein|nr:cytochrome c [Steroidobacteraceae bacterium]